MPNPLKSLGDRLSRQRLYGKGSGQFNKVRESLRVLFRKNTRECESTWIGPTPSLMGLPVEVRLVIYDYLFPEILYTAYTFCQEMPMRFSGALALLHTNRVLRAECQDIFVLLLVKRQQQILDHDLQLALRFAQGGPSDRSQMLGLWQDQSFYYDVLSRFVDKYVKIRGTELKKVAISWQIKHYRTLKRIDRLLDPSGVDTQSGRKKLWRSDLPTISAVSSRGLVHWLLNQLM